MAFAAVHIPEFPAAAWMRLEPAIRTHAVAVVEGRVPLERIVSFNRAAKTLGLTHGMSRVQAETCGPLVLRVRSLAEEKAAMDLVFAIAERFSPRVQIVASPLNAYAGAKQPAACLLLDQRGTQRLFGDAANYAGKLRAALMEQSFRANVAVAPNAEASLLLARSYAGACAVDEENIRSHLARLPISALRCDAALLATLTRWGIRTLGELAELPEAGLVSRIGQQGRRLQRLAQGIEEHLLIPEAAALVLAEQVLLDAPLESLESLLFLISPMLDTLLRQAMEHAYALRSVTVTLELEKLAPHTVTVKPAVPVQAKDLLLRLLNLKLQAEPPQAGILAVHVMAEPALPQVSQHGLFQAVFPEPGRLDLLVARLKAIVGEENVGSPALTNSHREDEFTLKPFAPRVEQSLEPATHRQARPALRRFRPVQPVRVRLHEARPVLVFWKSERLEVVAAAGPWQSSGYWWDGRSWAADEWDAIVSAPPRTLRLRHEPHGSHWFVAGLYD